jgi:hypothetical protein
MAGGAGTCSGSGAAVWRRCEAGRAVAWPGTRWSGTRWSGTRWPGSPAAGDLAAPRGRTGSVRSDRAGDVADFAAATDAASFFCGGLTACRAFIREAAGPARQPLRHAVRHSDAATRMTANHPPVIPRLHRASAPGNGASLAYRESGFDGINGNSGSVNMRGAFHRPVTAGWP